MNYQSDYCILGAGLAGLSLADTLADRGLSSIIIDKTDIASGASGTPGGLVNPATGRRAKKSWKAEQCYEAIAANLEKIQTITEDPFYVKNGLLRPALLEKMARKMREQYEKTTWPDGWCKWKSEGEIKEIHPGIECVNGGLWLPIGLSVNVRKYLESYAQYLKDMGIKMLLHSPPLNIAPSDNQRWTIKTKQNAIRVQNIVFAIGQGIATSNYWDWLPVNLIKGQVAEFKLPDKSLSFDHSISSLGYMARLDNPQTFVQGSTYEHDFKHLDPDEEGEQYLRKRMRRTLPNLEEQVITKKQWAGVRTSTPNYKPILGEHPKHRNMHLFSGLGSKGLLYGKFLAEHYADHLLHNVTLYPEIDISRFSYPEG